MARPRNSSLCPLPYRSAVSKNVIPDSSAASITFALASASMRQPKLLQPSPTRETSSEPILRVCMYAKCGSDVESQTSRVIRNRFLLFWVAQAASLLVSAACRDCLGNFHQSKRTDCFRQVAGNCGLAARAPRMRSVPRGFNIVGQRFLAADLWMATRMVALQKLACAFSITCEHNDARNPSSQTQAERHQPHCFVVHRFT